MAETTFVVYKKDNFGREKHIGAINSFSAKLRHSRRRQKQAGASKKNATFVEPKDAHDEAEKARVQVQNDALTLWKQAASGVADPFSSTRVDMDHNVQRVVSFDLRTLVGYATPPDSLGYGEDRMRGGVMLYSLVSNTRHYLVIHLLGGRVAHAEEEEASIRALDDPTTGYAYLSCRATVMAKLSNDPNMKHAALHFKQDALRHLRKNLSTSRLEHNFEEKIKAIHSLFTAEIAARKFEAAHAHSMALKYLLESNVSTVLVQSNLPVFQGVLWQEVHRALLSVTEVTFDLDRWTDMLGLPTRLLFWEPFSDYAPSPPAVDDEEVLLHPNLYIIMHKIQELASTPAAVVFDEPRSTLVRISAQGLMLQCRLFNRYVQNNIWLSGVFEETSYLLDKARVECYMCLAILYWLRRAMFNEKAIVGPTTKQFYGVGIFVRQQLQILLTNCEPDFDLDSTKARSQLFASYVGAIAEQTEMMGQDYFDVSSVPFHNKNFVLQACLMGLTTWAEVKIVLQDFLFHEGIGTVAETWFEKIQNLLSLASTSPEAS